MIANQFARAAWADANADRAALAASTKRVVEAREVYRAAVERHDCALRAFVASQGKFNDTLRAIS